jgi:hypothetical protein
LPATQEQYSSDGFLAGWVMTGTGSITVIAAGDSLPFSADGVDSRFDNPSSVLVNMSPRPGVWYGHFWGRMGANRALVGTIDGSELNSIGPFAGGTFGDKSITLTRP